MMPYIKFSGGNTPANATELIQHEDPDAPCFLGLWEARVSSDMQCELEGLPRDEWHKVYSSKIGASPYEGMQHTGGVGIVDEDKLRPFDTVINHEEYTNLEQSILDANQAYRKRVHDFMMRENAPNRRADPDAEHLGWRTRILVASYVELTHHQSYRVDDSCKAYCRTREYYPNGMTIQLID